MIPLYKEKYYMVFEPLKNVKINHFFARSVIEKHVSGIVYVDNVSQPKTYYIIHPYGMSLLFGNWENKEFNVAFRDYALNINQARNKHEWMQTYPDNWNEVLKNLFKGSLIKSKGNLEEIESNIIELNTRVNFKFNLKKYLNFKQKNIEADFLIVPTDEEIYTEMKGRVVPSKFWDNVEDFCKYGTGFSLFYENKLATTAFSSFIHKGYLELGMETIKEFRGKGFAKHTCSALIDYCIENNYEPIWSCRLENIGSYNLAIKLGFEPTIKLPYYRLSN